MPGIETLVRHLIPGKQAAWRVGILCSIAAVTLTTRAGGTDIHAAAAPRTQDSGATYTFVITLRGARVGTESVTVTRPGGMFKISMTGQIGPPVELITQRFEMTYGADWQPQQLTVDAALKNETVSIG